MEFAQDIIILFISMPAFVRIILHHFGFEDFHFFHSFDKSTVPTRWTAEDHGVLACGRELGPHVVPCEDEAFGFDMVVS